MDGLNQKQREQFEQIKKVAQENNNCINYTIFWDMLKDEHIPFSEELQNKIIHELLRLGIRIEALDEGETYIADKTEPDQFIPALVNIKQFPMNVSNLMERLENDEIDLIPAFQRKNSLWEEDGQSRLIESLMLRIPIPSFYFDATREEEWIVIDGLQRLTAFKEYLVDKEKKKLTGLQYLRDFNGKTFDQLPRQYIRRIKEAPIIAFCVDKGTPEQITYNIFQRINTGGVQLEPQEIRNAMYQGKATALAAELAVTEVFLRATTYAVDPNRVMDQEYVVRFLAFTELDYEKYYKEDIDSFLVMAMKKVNNYEEEDLARIRKNFNKVMTYSYGLLGEKAFRKIGGNGRRGPINKALFEIFSVCFSELSEVQLQKIQEKQKQFLEKYEKLFQEKEFVAELRSGKATDCDKRIKRGREFVKEFL